MRQRYETQQDVENEREIIDIFAEHMEVVPRKMPDDMRYGVMDFALQKQDPWAPSRLRVVGVAEVKDRRSWKMCYQTVFLDVNKARELKSYTDIGLTGYFVPRLLGDVHYVTMDNLGKWDCEFRGRTDRGDPNDISPCVMIPYDEFTRI